MKKLIFMLIPLFLMTFSFSANAQKNKNKNVVQPTIVNSPSVPAAPARVMKDFTNWLAIWAKDTTKAKMQFYAGGDVFFYKGTTPFEPVVNAVGDLVVVDRRFHIDSNRLGTFSRMDGNVIWVTFNVLEKGIIPGDTVDLPFSPNGTGDNIAYVLKAKSSTGQLPGTVSKTPETFVFNSNTFTISKGAYSVPLKVVISTEKKYVKTEDRKVNAPVTTAIISNPGFDPFLAPVQ